MNNLFDFFDPTTMLKRATKASATRRSGTVAETTRHSIMHTKSPDATLHHIIIAACPHPIRTRANDGEYYMVAYLSIPMDWLYHIDRKFASDWDVSFIGPAGMIQRLPPTLHDMEELLTERVYIGFDWFWLTASEPPMQQPHYDKIKPRLTQFAQQLRDIVESK